MMDENNNQETDKESEVYSPKTRRRSTIENAKASPAKVVKDEQDPTTIKHVDRKNAVYIAYFDEFKIKAREIAEEIEDDSRKYEQSESTQIHINKHTSVKLVELHSLILTYFEGIALRLLRWSMEVEHELEEYIQKESYFSREDWDESDIETIHDRVSNLDYMKALSNSGLLESPNALHNVKSRRNDFVHDPESAMKIRTNKDRYPGKKLFDKIGRPEHLNEENLGDPLPEILADCLEAINNIEAMIEQHLPVDEDIYGSLAEKK